MNKTINDERKADTQAVGQKADHKETETRVDARKRGNNERKTQHRTNIEYDAGEEERLCKKLEQLIAVHRLLSYPSPLFLVLI